MYQFKYNINFFILLASFIALIFQNSTAASGFKNILECHESDLNLSLEAEDPTVFNKTQHGKLKLNWKNKSHEEVSVKLKIEEDSQFGLKHIYSLYASKVIMLTNAKKLYSLKVFFTEQSAELDVKYRGKGEQVRASSYPLENCSSKLVPKFTGKKPKKKKKTFKQKQQEAQAHREEQELEISVRKAEGLRSKARKQYENGSYNSALNNLNKASELSSTIINELPDLILKIKIMHKLGKNEKTKQLLSEFYSFEGRGFTEAIEELKQKTKPEMDAIRDEINQ